MDKRFHKESNPNSLKIKCKPMTNITYLLGAGASANCLPTYSNFRKRFNDFFLFVNGFDGSSHVSSSADYKSLLADIRALTIEFDFHSTPDTIAKKYFHSDEGELKKLKRIIILFLIFEQITYVPAREDGRYEKETIDKRYDAFIAAILKPIPGRIELIPNVKVLTWNYDLQFEIAYSKYRNLSIPTIQKELQSYPQILYNEAIFNDDIFSLIHLNGIAYSKGDKGEDYIGNTIQEHIPKIEYLLSVFHNMLTAYRRDSIAGQDLLSFAWEKLNDDFSLKENAILESAFKVSKKTNILIVNGYSFPSFNRIIDSKILKEMRSLKKIYVQSPDFQSIERILKDILPNVTIENVGYWNQFFVPDYTIDINMNALKNHTRFSSH